MNSPKAKAVVVLVFFVVGLTVAGPPKKFSTSILGKSRVDAEKILGAGKPNGSFKVTDSFFEMTYGWAGFKEVMASYIKGNLEGVYFDLKKPSKDWKGTLKMIGLSSAGVTAVPNKHSTPSRPLFDLKGVKGLPKGWQVRHGEMFGKYSLMFFSDNVS